ncbi:hypothetical protein [Robiginitalea aurantiaca]|uniref:Adhesin domain-containing protein n=1 Tax=Robiginitalea aurantiaca TaxID=3056915 RepID=A0ABT7WHQ1_9FLAO|nr:hypothetical protein [Robiginitalea aurantiaca]MDM9632440.1 hypothetical protein [Robiginitalea aurantiaca]
MKTLLFNRYLLILMVLCISPQVFANDFKGKHTKEKTIKKEFDVNADALLKINNSYGNLVLNSWNENRVVIEVHITVNGNNESKVNQRLEEIDVDFESSASMVSAKTVFGKKSGWGWKGNNNVNLQVNYTIKMPVKNSVNLSNDYGNIILDRVDGHAKISCDYGRMDLGELRGRNNELNFDYTSKSRIGFMNSGEINADYSGFMLEKTGNLILKADYTNANVMEMENLEYNCDYGSVEIARVNNVLGRGDYVNVKLGYVSGNVDLEADYGGIQIEEMKAEAGNVSISTNYTGIKLGYDPGYHFDFMISTEYAGVKGKEDLEINISKEKSSDRYYEGYHGSANSGNSVRIQSDYGSITLRKN